MFFLIVATLLVGLAYWYSLVRRYPRGPFPLPIIGNLHHLDAARVEWQMIEWKKKYGPVFTIWIPYPVVIFADHQSIKEHFVKHGEVFSSRAYNFAVDAFSGTNLGLIYNKQIKYKEQRRFALHALRDLGFGKDVMEKTTIELAQRAVKILREKNGEPVNMNDYFAPCVVNVITKLVFGEVHEHNDPELLWFQHKVEEAFEMYFHPVIMAADTMPWLRHILPYTSNAYRVLVRSNQEVDAYLTKQIEARKAKVDLNAEPACYVDAFFVEMRKQEKTGSKDHVFTSTQLLRAVYDLYTAGMDTTIRTLLFGFIYLLNNPRVQDRLHKELDETVEDREIELEDARRMPYLNATLQELQRVVNILQITLEHAIAEDFTVSGYRLPAGTVVVPEFQCVHLDDELYPRPELFIPERHLNEKGEFVKDEKITPFSVGKRSCLGESLARSELLLFFSTFIQHFDVKPVEGVVPPKLEFSCTSLRSPKQFECRMIPRKSGCC